MFRDRNSPEEQELRAFLKQRREERGMSQRQLSLVLDNTPTFVSKYESGERFLTFTEVVLICELLHVNTPDIVAQVAQVLHATNPVFSRLPTKF